MLLKKIRYINSNLSKEFPFNLNWLNELNDLRFASNVTFFVGDNGIGKSTLLEAIAINAQSITLSDLGYSEKDEYGKVMKLSQSLKLEWTFRSQKGFFFRADDFISFIRDTKKRKLDAERALKEIDLVNPNPNAFERQPYLNTLAAIKNLYGSDLNELSHGQAFLSLFQSRLHPNGLYILDEPESPLTPQNQLSLLYMIHEQVKNGSQFLISTHSPVLMAYPNADIIEISKDRLQPISYNDIDHVQFMKNFMDDPQRFMHYTFKDN